MLRRFGLLAALLLSACSQAYSDRGAAPPMVAVASDGRVSPTAAPYGVEVIAENGAAMPTYQKDGRFYVLGEQGARYLIRVTNPTSHRIEAVVTVDGLDVIDGEPGDLRKRGYVVPAGGDLEIEGFRTSTAEVATFRFSSVGASYAARKGKARNVGVIAVAIFDEVPPQEMILEQQPAPEPPPVIYYDEHTIKDYDGWSGDDAAQPREGRNDAPAKRAPTGGGGGTVSAGESAGAPVMQPPPPPDYRPQDKSSENACCSKQRSGLGTEYGEQRYSAATWTRFVRSSDHPVAVAELRYNDAAGLTAMGIDVGGPRPDPEEVTKRETADPFPGDPTFSRPPAGIR
jgi:hypothetical protein